MKERERRLMPLPFDRSEYVSASALGRSSVTGGGFLFPPCLRPLLPLRVRNLQPFVLATAARPRPSAVTLEPLRLASETGASYSVAPLVARRFPRFSLRRASLAFPFSGKPAQRCQRSPAVRADLPRSSVADALTLHLRPTLTGVDAIGDGFILVVNSR